MSNWADQGREGGREPSKWLYVFQAAHAIKVGVADDVHARRRGVQTASGLAVSIVAAYEVPAHKVRVAESAAHHALGEYRTIGEWFECDPEVAIKAVEFGVMKALGRRRHPPAPFTPEPRRISPVVALASLGGRATRLELREAVGDPRFSGHQIRAMRNRGWVEPWADVIVLTPAGWAEARRLEEAVA